MPDTGGTDAAALEALVEFLYLVPVGIIKFGPDGGIDMMNPMAAQLLMPLAADADMSDLYRLFGAVLPDLRARIQAFRAPAGPIIDQMQIAVPASAQVLTLGINRIDARTLMAVVQDITRAIEQETRIRDDQTRFRAIFESIRDYAIYTVDLDGRVSEWNRSLKRLGGWQPADLLGASVTILFAPTADIPAGTALLARAREHGTAEFEGWGLRKDGTMFWGNTVATALHDREGNAAGYVLVTRDLTERKHLEDRLLTLANTDPLTGALNRRAGEELLATALRGWRQDGRRFCVLMIDCDHFKLVNDIWGHEVGDKVLVALVEICRENLRGGDIAVRWGGEEFLLMLAATSRDAALAIAERLRRTIEDRDIDRGGGTIRITVSIGVAEVHEGDTRADEMVRRADRSLYFAKNAGRNRVVAR
jgi:diguanylate cyclase (GGDEF)-like protein/PAS domain S-box-containing protein